MGWVDPFTTEGEVGSTKQFAAWEEYKDCYGNPLNPRSVSFASWSSSNTSVATVNSAGLATAVAPGTAQIQAIWQVVTWEFFEVDCVSNQFYNTSQGGYTVKCPVPVNFRQTGVQDQGNGTLSFTYRWDSSSGRLSDLAGCTVGEYVIYPSPDPYRPPSPPWPSDASYPNPSVVDLNATTGTLIDDHLVPGSGNFVTPYSASSFLATQFYRYRCPCVSQNYTNLMGPLNIKEVR
jgi:hypothetical protein